MWFGEGKFTVQSKLFMQGDSDDLLLLTAFTHCHFINNVSLALFLLISSSNDTKSILRQVYDEAF